MKNSKNQWFMNPMLHQLLKEQLNRLYLKRNMEAPIIIMLMLTLMFMQPKFTNLPVLMPVIDAIPINWQDAVTAKFVSSATKLEVTPI
jgi:hypothetical protein